MNRVGRAVMGLGLVALASALGAHPAVPPAGWEWRPVTPVASPLRILVQYDMEGLSGIDRLAMVQCGTNAYAAGVDRLVADVNAVIEGLSQAHVARIDVLDRHGSGCDKTPDLPTERLDPRAQFVDEAAAAFFTRIRRKEWDAVVLVGGHASPGREGFLEHVGSFGFERIVNGVSTSESEQSECATSRTSAELLPPDAVRSDLIANVKAAVARRNEARLLAAIPPFTGAYKAVWPQTLDEIGAVPGVDTTGGLIRVTGANLREVNDKINRIGLLVANVLVAQAYWDAVDRDPGLDQQRDSVFMAKWIDGPKAPKAKP